MSKQSVYVVPQTCLVLHEKSVFWEINMEKEVSDSFSSLIHAEISGGISWLQSNFVSVGI